MGEITRLLNESRAGRTEAQNALFQTVYAELMRLARARLSRVAPLTQLDAPGLVHEAYLRLVDQVELPGSNRAMFFAYAAGVMRSVVVDYMRERNASKRGGRQYRITLATNDAALVVDGRQFEKLNDALRALAAIDERAARVVELRYYTGLSIEEISTLLESSPATVKRLWQKARAFLYRALQE